MDKLSKKDMPKKKTYGHQLVENIEKNKGINFAETREVTLHYGHNILLKKIEEDVIKNPDYEDWDIIYILIMGKKNINEHITNVVLGCTPYKPKMRLKCVLYSYEPKTNILKYHWMLPQTIEMCKAILQHEEGFDKDYVKSCRNYLIEIGHIK